MKGDYYQRTSKAKHEVIQRIKTAKKANITYDKEIIVSDVATLFSCGEKPLMKYLNLQEDAGYI